MNKLNQIINKLYEQKDLTVKESSFIFNKIMDGKVNEIIISSFLTALKIKGETFTEILGATKVLRKKSLKIISPENTIDTCGTGGDMKNTLNISTAAALVAASTGVKIAKHGNRSVSSKSGSADVLELLGIKINNEIKDNEKMLKEKNFCFMFAQLFHTAMKNVGPVRKTLGTRTIFNLLGPLTSPAQVKNQMIGVFSDEFLSRIVKLLQKRKSKTIMSVRSVDGMDELSTTSNNKICLLKEGEITEFVLNPEEYNLQKGIISDIQINTKQEAIESFVNVLNNNANRTMTEITALNAAGGLVVSGMVNGFSDGLELALQTIRSGKAFDKLKEFAKHCNGMEKLEGVEKS